MRYRSTRGGVRGVSFVEAVMMGLGPDRGLLVPESIPTVSASTLARWKGLAFDELAFEVISLYVDREEISAEELRELVRGAYATFRSKDVTPVVELDRSRVHLLELFHGPTFAFKDVALQFLGRLFELILKKKGGEDHLTILGATSGDTGSSAIEGVRGRDSVECFILYPQNRTSKIQEAQMATVEDPNVHAIALAGAEFDDCQKIVKALFADAQFRDRNALGAVNSINWARIVAQIVYYFYAAFRLEAPPAFSVPTGNFGDVLAGWYATRMGCPCSGLLVATNANDILARFFASGTYERPAAGAVPTLAPSMDICVSSNFERFVFHCSGDDADVCARLMADFENAGSFIAPEPLHVRARAYMRAASVDRDGILRTIRDVHESAGYVLDPHTACGVKAALDLKDDLPSDAPIVCLACAHHAKFPDAVRQAVGDDHFAKIPPEPKLQTLLDLPFRNTVLANSATAVKDFIDATMARRRANKKLNKI
ncbi:hypothetical protein CTAYLR_006032 [Chrysophaeum taylorii]|uniref:threonine synthase n=1 Tax=Chrysophaeum taylorii TaxID=2483200 RepID=A0AAD7ULM8_9STRA|nr:hypothetical protein CTAYLR_006032 [Chrysophaeum taylorii]